MAILQIFANQIQSKGSHFRNDDEASTLRPFDPHTFRTGHSQVSVRAQVCLVSRAQVANSSIDLHQEVRYLTISSKNNSIVQSQ